MELKEKNTEEMSMCGQLVSLFTTTSVRSIHSMLELKGILRPKFSTRKLILKISAGKKSQVNAKNSLESACKKTKIKDARSKTSCKRIPGLRIMILTF
jgi:hypothetical protein